MVSWYKSLTSVLASLVADDKFIRCLSRPSGQTAATLQMCHCESQSCDLSKPVMYSKTQPLQHSDKVHGAGSSWQQESAEHAESRLTSLAFCMCMWVAHGGACWNNCYSKRRFWWEKKKKKATPAPLDPKWIRCVLLNVLVKCLLISSVMENVIYCV